MTIIDQLVPTPSRKVHEALWAAIIEAIDIKGYVPCSMANATRNATITEVCGVECYSKTDVVNQLMDDALLNGIATSKPVGILAQCRTYPIPDGATTANQPMQGDASKSAEHRQSVDMTQRGAR